MNDRSRAAQVSDAGNASAGGASAGGASAGGGGAGGGGAGGGGAGGGGAGGASKRALDGTRWSVLIAIVLLAAVFWLAMTRRIPQPSTHPAVGRPAPTLDLVQLIPQTPPLAEEPGQVGPDPGMLSGPPAAGAVTLLHFWGTWCPPCRLEYPELVEMVRELGSEPRFQFITVSCGAGGGEDYDELQELTLRYYDAIGAGSLRTFADLGGTTRNSAAQQLGESVVYPTTILISADQRIAGVWLGYSPEGVGEMRQAATELLQQPL